MRDASSANGVLRVLSAASGSVPKSHCNAIDSHRGPFNQRLIEDKLAGLLTSGRISDRPKGLKSLETATTAG